MAETKIKQAKEFTRKFDFAKKDGEELRTVTVTGNLTNQEM